MLDDNSWVKIYRKITEWEWWDDAECVKLWLWLLCKAQTKDRKWSGKVIKRGQLITTLDGIKSECKISIDKIRRRLGYLQNSGAILIETTNANHFITILNYGTYQDRNTYSKTETTNEPQTKRKRATNRQQADNKQTENEPQTDNKQTTPIKEYKNIRNNNIRENPNIIIQEDKNERIFFKENEKKVFSIEEIKKLLADAGIYWKAQGYLDFKENNENPEASFNYNGGIVKAAKQYQKLHPEIIGAKPKKETISYKSLEVAPDVKHTLHALLETSDIAESSRQMIENIVKPRITADKVEIWAESKSQYEVFKDLFEAAGNLLQGHYNLPYVILG